MYRTSLYTLTCLIFLLGAQSLWGQGKWVKKGDKHLESGEYEAALERYEWAARKGDNLVAFRRINYVNRKLNRYAEARNWAGKAARHPEHQPEDFFNYGLALMSVEEYDSAEVWFGRYVSSNPNDPRAAEMLAASQNFRRLLADSVRYDVLREGFNTKGTEFGAVPYRNGLVYSSDRSRDLGVVYTSKLTDKPLLDLYFLEYDTAKARWSRPQALPGEVNSRFNEGPACFAPGDSVMYFTRNNYSKDSGIGTSGKLSKLKIYRARLIDEAWTQIEPLPFNGNEFATGHPALSPDGSRLYFVSDRPGGQGGTDLWFADVLPNGGFGTPKNLGPEVNTVGDEMFPFVHSDGTLYFSSDGRFGLGDLDIFYTRERASGWLKPLNMGFPINSPQDDFALTLMADGKSGYFSSNRNSRKDFDDDVYSFGVRRPVFDCEPVEIPELCVVFYEVGAIEVDSLPFQYEWSLGDGTKKRGLEVEHCYPGPGTYLVELNVIDTTNGFLFFTQASREFTIPDLPQVKINAPEIAELGTELDMTAEGSVVPGCDLREFYWDFGDGQLGKGASLTHTYEQTGTYTLKLGATGTDSSSGAPCQSCRSRTIRIMSAAALETFNDSVAAANDSIRQEMERMVTRPYRSSPDSIDGKPVDLSTDIGGVRTLQNPSADISNQTNELFDVRDIEEKSFSVQLKESKDRIPTDSANFGGISGVNEVKTTDGYSYTVGESDRPETLYPIYQDARTRGYTYARVVAVMEDSVLSPNDQNVILDVPGLESPLVISVVEGIVTDFNGNPLEADIKVEDLLSGKFYTSTNSDSSGRYLLELPNGTIYSFFADIPGFVPVSDNIDLRDATVQKRYVGNIQAISIEDMMKTGMPVRLNNIFFDFDKAILRDESFPELKRLAQILNENPGIRVEIRGHTDSDGNDEYNRALSKRRAMAVNQWLVSNGFLPSRFIATGFGESRPVATNETAEGKQRNRRVEFRFIK